PSRPSSKTAAPPAIQTVFSFSPAEIIHAPTASALLIPTLSQKIYSLALEESRGRAKNRRRSSPANALHVVRLSHFYHPLHFHRHYHAATRVAELSERHKDLSDPWSSRFSLFRMV
ncbi:MAG: hypothetical protein WAM80_04990, partial [Candidatus Acidiferrales bacterium]